MTARVLNLDEVFERDIITLNKVDYELRNPQEFGIIEDHNLRTLIHKINEAASSTEEPTDADAEAAAQMLRDLATMLVVDLKDEIPDWACVAIFQFWMEGRPENPPVPAPTPARKQRTGARSSQSSKRSTGATQKRGSASRATS